MTEPRDEDLWRELAPQVLARLVRTYGTAQFEWCEDAVQDALLDAYRQWGRGAPDDPRAWLVATARRRYIDRIRSDRSRRDREERQARLESPLAGAATAEDDALLLLRLCCHPDVPRSGQVALTLRAVAGLSTAQIANLHQLPEPTVAQRITRAKRRIAAAGRSLPRPGAPDERLPQVLNVLYLMLTESHHTTDGAPSRDAALAAEAVRLARALRTALPDDSEVAGLLALMLFTESRHGARVGPGGTLVPLAEQDRSRWDAGLIAEANALLDQAVPGADPGPYLLQACIAALHAQAADTDATDWAEILALYRLLEIRTGRQNPTVTLNRIVAQAMTQGEDAALVELEELQRAHPGLPRLGSVRAHLLERAGRPAEAEQSYRTAIRETRNLAERRHLEHRLRALVEGLDAPPGRHR